jgi:ABC-2 type transport system ATP-binding protein
MINTNHLRKEFGSFVAVEDISLNIESGETYGFLGPNGAGKTTTIMMILGILKPTNGEVRIFGERISEQPFKIKKRLGVVAEYQNYYDEMTAWEYLMFFANLLEVENAETRVSSLMERLNLWEFRDVIIGGYSTGMQRKLGFVRALIHSPDVLILDEPVSGLDPFGIVQVREMLNDERKDGTTVMISSHILSEVERTADRVGIIARGKLLVEDTMQNLRQLAQPEKEIELDLYQPEEALIHEISTLPFVTNLKRQNELFIISTLSDKDYRPDLGSFLTKQGAVIQGMRAIETSLEDAFITITEKHIRDWTKSESHQEIRDE